MTKAAITNAIKVTLPRMISTVKKELPTMRGHFRQRSLGLVQGFIKGRSGVAATEFALMVPAMSMIWIGMVVATDALTADKKVTLLARTLADMTTQMQTVTQSNLDSIFEATQSVMWPQPADRLGMRLTSIDIDGNSQPFIDWSVVPSSSALKGNFSALTRCAKFTTLPAGIKIARTTVVYAEVAMDYKASVASEVVDKLFGSASAGGQMALSESLYMRPRQSLKVQFSPAPTPATCPGYVS